MGLALYDPLRGVIRFPAGAAAISRASEAGFRSGPADIAKVKKIAGMMWEQENWRTASPKRWDEQACFVTTDCASPA
jgi:hypothetical protein